MYCVVKEVNILGKKKDMERYGLFLDGIVGYLVCFDYCVLKGIRIKYVIEGMLF